MARSAHVTSIDAVQRMAAALHGFRGESVAALDDLQLEIRRALEWIHHDRKEYWAKEVRRGWERLAAARLQLQQAMTYRRIADRQPSCIDEKRAVEAAKRRLQLAQEKVETVRHCTLTIEQAVNEYRGGSTQFTSWLEGDLPKALAALDRMTEALQSYLAMATPGESATPEEGIEAAVPAASPDMVKPADQTGPPDTQPPAATEPTA